MRLTLRTLLAYLDDTLPPAAAREIGQKLAESPVAQELVSRIREVTRRRRIVAPSMSGDEINPNEMAEYLDNLLPSGAIEVVENVCLQSDIHLAEAAACHQILTMIGQPAAVSDEARRRMSDLVRTPESETAPQPELKSTPGLIPVPSFFSQRPLLARVLSVSAVVVGALVIVGLIWVSLKVPDRQVASREEEIFRPNVLPAESTDTAPPNIETVKPEIRPLPESTPAEMPAEESTTPAEAAKPADKKPEEEPTAEKPDEPKVEKPQPAAADTTPPPAKRETPATSDNAKAKPEAAPLPPAPPAEPMPVGAYSSTTGVLMRHERANQEWRRIAPRSVVNAQDALLCLPTYRAAVQLTDGFSVELVGETELSFLPPAEGSQVRVQLDRGRIVLGTNSDAATFQIDFLDQSWSITLKAPETVVGLELTAPWKPGKPAAHEGVIYLPRGEAEFRSGSRADQLGGPVQVRWSSTAGFRDRESLSMTPVWLDKEEFNILMLKASDNMQGTIHLNASAVLPLVESVGDARRETRMLAVQCLGAIGRLPALIDAMNTPDKREVRLEAIRALRQYMARGPAQEAALHDALVAKLKDRGENFLRLLHGFTDDEFKQRNTYDVLITLLDSSDLAVRELAIDNLTELAGKPANVNYSPDLRNENAINA